MNISACQEADIPAMLAIWNSVVAEGLAFPQEEELDLPRARQFFAQQSFCGVARLEPGQGGPGCGQSAAWAEGAVDQIAGLYILHPNNVGRCGHIANASYAVAPHLRGRGIGAALIRHSLAKARELGFGVMQFNAVCADNPANRLYQRLGFQPLGSVPGGFRRPGGELVDINLYCKRL